MATKTDPKPNKKSDKKDKNKKGATKEIAAAAGEAVSTDASNVAQSAGTAESKSTRVYKNATEVVIDFTKPESATAWLQAFYEQSKAQPPKKGYDQHWNKRGFIHAGPAVRLPNDGAANMIVFLGDMLVQRESKEDADAGKILDFCINFLQTRRATLEAENIARMKEQLEAFNAKQAAAT